MTQQITPCLMDEVATMKLSIAGFIDFMGHDGDAVWATNQDQVQKLVLGEAQPVASASVPAAVGVMVTAFGSLWAASLTEQAIYRIDLTTHELVAKIQTGLADASAVSIAGKIINGTGELSIAAGSGSIWVTSDACGILSRIDPHTNQVIAEIAIAPNSYNTTYAFDRVWVSNPPINTLQCIDPHTNQVSANIPVGLTPWFIAAGEGAIWTLNQGGGTVSRVDPHAQQVVETIVLPPAAAGFGGDITTGGGKVWVRTTNILLIVIDAITNQITDIYITSEAAGSGGVMVAGHHVWVTAHDTNTVWVLDTQPTEVIGR